MAKLNSLFETFLSNIEPDPEAVAYASEAHTRVRNCLEQDEKFKEFLEDSFLYGSYKRHTAVGTIKDVDIVVLTTFDPNNEEHTPTKVLRKLKDALARCYGNADFLEYQRRSIRVDEPLPEHDEIEMTLDIIPAVATDGEDKPLWVPDREQKKWIQSHPKGHLKYTTGLNDAKHSNGQFVPLVKMMKWWWKYQTAQRQPDVERPKPKGFWIECLTGENFDIQKHDWADHFIEVLERVTTKYAAVTTVPELKDPGLATVVVKTNMTFAEFELFLEAVKECLELAKVANNEPDALKSSELWREIFGEKFPLYDAEETQATKMAAHAIPLNITTHAQPLQWPLETQNRYSVQLDAYLYWNNQRFGGINSNSRVIRNGLDIKYVARTNVPKPYEVRWQVVNTGKHATLENGLRGDYFKARGFDHTLSHDPLINWEHSQYTGKHWIECFIIKDNKCIARSGRFYLNIRNPAFV